MYPDDGGLSRAETQGTPRTPLMSKFPETEANEEVRENLFVVSRDKQEKKKILSLFFSLAHDEDIVSHTVLVQLRSQNATQMEHKSSDLL